MTKHIWSLLCKKSITDEETHNLTIVETLEEITFSFTKEQNERRLEDVKSGKTPHATFDFELISCLEIEDIADKKLTYEIVLFDPHKKVINKQEQNPPLNDIKKRLRLKTLIGMIPITQEGTYTYIIMIKDESGKTRSVAELPLDVKFNLTD